MSDPRYQHGAFSWNELATTDPNAAKKFYTKLFGWTTQEWGEEEEIPYTILKAGDKEVGGLMPIPSEMGDTVPYWGSYVTVDDVDASTKQAKALGAKILVPPQDIPQVGRFALIQDPQGAKLSLITYFKEEQM